MYFVISYVREAGGAFPWQWELFDENGLVVAHGGRYRTMRACREAVTALIHSCPQATVRYADQRAQASLDAQASQIDPAEPSNILPFIVRPV